MYGVFPLLSLLSNGRLVLKECLVKRVHYDLLHSKKESNERRGREILKSWALGCSFRGIYGIQKCSRHFRSRNMTSARRSAGLTAPPLPQWSLFTGSFNHVLQLISHMLISLGQTKIWILRYSNDFNWKSDDLPIFSDLNANLANSFH